MKHARPFKYVSCFWQSHVCMPNFLQVSYMYMYYRIVNLDYTQLHTVNFARTTLGQNPGSVSGVSSASLFLVPSSATTILLVHPSLPAVQSIPTLISFAKKVCGCTMCTHALDLPPGYWDWSGVCNFEGVNFEVTKIWNPALCSPPALRRCRR